MAKSQPSAAAFRHDPLGCVERLFERDGDVFRLPDGSLCVAEPELAHDVLRGRDGRYGRMSGFFDTPDGTVGPRSVQVAIGRGARTLLHNHISDRAEQLTELVARTTDTWPLAGTRLAHAYLRDCLLKPDTPDSLHRTLSRVLERGALASARRLSIRLSRAMFRERVIAELADEVRRRRAVGEPAEPDLLDVVSTAAPDADPRAVAEVFLFLFRSSAGAVGYVLSWALYLSGSSERIVDCEPEWVIREAMRLRPVAWMFGRAAEQAHRIGEFEVPAGDRVAVCAYLVQRHPRYWRDPAEFQPERWATRTSDEAYLPFGGGPFVCAGASVCYQLTSDLLRAVAYQRSFAVAPHHGRPIIAGAMIPPQFAVR